MRKIIDAWFDSTVLCCLLHRLMLVSDAINDIRLFIKNLNWFVSLLSTFSPCLTRGRFVRPRPRKQNFLPCQRLILYGQVEWKELRVGVDMNVKWYARIWVTSSWNNSFRRIHCSLSHPRWRKGTCSTSTIWRSMKYCATGQNVALHYKNGNSKTGHYLMVRMGCILKETVTTN